MHKALEGEFNLLSRDIYKFLCHRQHFKHALDDIWSMFSIKFSIFGLAFEEFLNKNFMAVLPARERQLRLYSKFKATQGSRPVQSTNSEHLTTGSHVTAMLTSPRGQFLNLMAGTEFFKL